ncbi:thioredoxin family protein, partial [Candidatus Bathyarchaeota archaeon]|nr:thioredoxin family protein [Candidatus Bathyarchaeota archaeon]
MLKPKFKELAEKMVGMVDFYELEIANNEIWKGYSIMSLPSVIIFRGGKSAERFGAVLRVDELEKALTK